MSILRLPIDSSETYYSVDITLDGSNYTFDIFWNERNESWYFNVFDAQQEAIVSGQRIGTNAYLNRYFQTVLPGLLMAVSTMTNDLDDPNDVELGTRVIILYTPEEDIASVLA